MDNTDAILTSVISSAALAALLPETQAALRQWAQQQAQRFGNDDMAARQPAFPYQALPPSARLTYELADWGNVAAYLPLFATDPSPFVDERFKQRAALEAYAGYLLTEARFSWKRGAGDWLVRRRADGQPLGVLHLYDLSHEVIGGRVPHCAVGYALATPFRQQGYGAEMLGHLLAQAAQLFGRTEARAISAADNLASQALLRTCRFALLEERPATRYGPATQLWQRYLT